MNKYDAERAIIANRPGEPFVLVQRVDGDEVENLDALDWQAETEPPTWKEVQAWVRVLAPEPPHPIQHLAEVVRAAKTPEDLLDGLRSWAEAHGPEVEEH